MKKKDKGLLEFMKQLNLLLRKNRKTLEQELKLMKSYLGDYKQRKGTIGSSKMAAETELDHEGSKRQKTNEASGSVQEQPEEEEKELSQEDLQKMMMVVPVEEVYVEALQRYMHDPLKWRLYDTCGVHHVSTKRGIDIFMLVEKEYPLSKGVLTLMLVNRLLVEQHSEMANELLRKIFIQANRPRQ
ncbi:hypothetical protein Tco_1207038 [Tanacetum coccineum]